MRSIAKSEDVFILCDELKKNIFIDTKKTIKTAMGVMSKA
jgi:hypothetical protein